MSGPFIKTVNGGVAKPDPLITYGVPEYCYSKFASRGRGNLNPNGDQSYEILGGALIGEYLTVSGTNTRWWNTSAFENGSGCWCYVKYYKASALTNPNPVTTWHGMICKRRYSTTRKVQVSVIQTSSQWDPPQCYTVWRNLSGGSASSCPTPLPGVADTDSIGKAGSEFVTATHLDQIVNGTPFVNSYGAKGGRTRMAIGDGGTGQSFDYVTTRTATMYNSAGGYGINFGYAIDGSNNVYAAPSDWYLVEFAYADAWALSQADENILLKNGLIASFGLWA